MRGVVLHVGLPKTGTSFVQSVLRENQQLLAERGILLPDAPGQDLFLAVLHLTGRSAAWGRSDEAGRRAWERIVGDLRRRPGTAVISSETLCLADENQVKRVLDDLGDVEVDVVVTVRDPGRQLPAEWQEGVKHGRQGSYESFLDAVLEEPDALDEAARRRHRRFWAGQDPVAVLDRWAAALPPERVHVVVSPPAGAPLDELWRRFAPVLGVAAEDVAVPTGQVNVSLGAVQLEVLRRVNKRFTRRGREQSYGTVAKRLYAGRILRGQRGEKVVLPKERYDVADAVARGWIEAIEERGWHVTGHLGDLRPAPPEGSASPVVTAEAMLEAALDATADLLAEIERLTQENAALRADSSGRPPAAVTALARRGRSWVQGRYAR